MGGFFYPHGGKVIGSSAVETSVAGVEILPDATITEGWSRGYKLREFSLNNIQACTVSINDGDAIYLTAGQGINLNSITVTSVKIMENSITYNWMGVC